MVAYFLLCLYKDKNNEHHIKPTTDVCYNVARNPDTVYVSNLSVVLIVVKDGHIEMRRNWGIQWYTPKKNEGTGIMRRPKF